MISSLHPRFPLFGLLLCLTLTLWSGITLGQSAPSYVPTNGLVGWWGFNGNAQDGSGNGNHGTVNGATLTTDRFGNSNTALNQALDGSHVRTQSVISNSPNNFTISLWVNPSQIDSVKTQGITGGEGYGVMSVIHPAHGSNWGSQSNNAGVGINIGTNQIQIVEHTHLFVASPLVYSAQLTGWHHIVVVYEQHVPKLFVDGNLVATGLQSNIQSVHPSSGFCSWYNQSGFGSSFNSNGSLGGNFKGKFDDIGIWNRALTQQEIRDLYYVGITLPILTSCLGDTTSVTISNPTLTGVANASLRMTYNPDSLTYVGFNSLNPAFNGMTISGGNGVVLMDWNSSTNQTIAAGNMVNLRFRVNGNSNINWDTTTIPCEISDVNFDVIPQTYISGSITQNTQRLTWNRDVCQGQSFALGNQSYTTSGTYQGRLTGTGGACDTLITLNLNVIPTQTILPAVTTCSNQPYSFNGLSLSTSGTYWDTLINSLGCDSILQLNLTVNPSYNQNQNVVICPGTTYSFGGQNLSSSGTYSHTYTTQQGCDSLVNLTLSVADSVNISSSTGVNGFCPGSGVRLGLPNPIPGSQYQWMLNGTPIHGETFDTLHANQVGTYQLRVEVSSTCSLLSNEITLSVLNCNRVRGDLRYDNNAQTPMAGVPVHLKTIMGNILMSDTTDSLGKYEMVGYANGNYLLDAGVNYQWGGVNSTDALWVSRYFTQVQILTPLRITAGDVNGNGVTNSLDALTISRRGANIISSFSVGNFVNSRPSVVAQGNPVDVNLRVLSTGDVNGSYSLPVTTPVLVLDTVYGNGNVGTAVVRFTTAGSGVFERGIVWSSSPNPTQTSNKSIAGTGGFGFTHSFSFIDPNNIQYARAYARTSAGVYYSPERSFTPIPGLRCPGTPTVTDIDGNTYYTVQIGNQCWTQSNLKVSKYRNGDNIPTGLSDGQWSSTTSGAYAINNNDPVNDGLYGKLYNWYAVDDSRGLCPTGWHVPSDAEWTSLTTFLGGTSEDGGKMKSTDIQPTPGGWLSPNTGATNSSGFTGKPGGYRVDAGWYGGYDGSYGKWWSSSVSNAGDSWYRYLVSNYEHVFVHNLGQNEGFSIRCLKNTLPQVNTTSITNVTPSTALVTGEVISEGDQNIIRGFCYSTTSNPTLSNDTTMNGTGLGVYSDTLQNLTPSTTYYVRAYATNSVGTSYGSELNFTTINFMCGTTSIVDIDGNINNTVQIGTQCWTQSNLKVTKYRNGDNIPTGLSDAQWGSTTSGAYAIYSNDPVNDALYGKLYNWYAVTDSRGLCPTGWHVPSDGEWTTLTDFLGGESVAGGAMKSTATQPTWGGWNTPNTGATNSSGFTGLPGGYRGFVGGFVILGYVGLWWSSSVAGSGDAWYRELGYNGAIAYRDGNDRRGGFSVRCARD